MVILISGQKTLLSNIFMVGGNCQLNGFKQRIQNEIELLNPALKRHSFIFHDTIKPETANYK